MFYDGYQIIDMSEMYNNMSNYGGSIATYDLTSYTTKDISYKSKFTNMFNKNKLYSSDPVFIANIGIVGDKTLQDTIYLGKTLNKFMKFQLFSNSISININNSTNVSLFDMVDLEVQSTLDNSFSAEPYSGKYLVTSISHSIVKDSGYSKRILLCRNGINKSIFKKDYVGIE